MSTPSQPPYTIRTLDEMKLALDYLDSLLTSVSRIRQSLTDAGVSVLISEKNNSFHISSLSIGAYSELLK